MGTQRVNVSYDERHPKQETNTATCDASNRVRLHLLEQDGCSLTAGARDVAEAVVAQPAIQAKARCR